MILKELGCVTTFSFIVAFAPNEKRFEAAAIFRQFFAAILCAGQPRALRIASPDSHRGRLRTRMLSSESCDGWRFVFFPYETTFSLILGRNIACIDI